ncbi:MAG: hypothetical protein ACPGEG_01400 [Salibacteraceae bacterium]
MRLLFIISLLCSIQWIHAQEIKVLSGSTEAVAKIKAFELVMNYDDISIKDHDSEEDLKEKVIAELDREAEDSGQDWLSDWEENKTKKYPSKVSRSYTKTLFKVGQIIATRSFEGETDGQIIIDTESISLGFKKGRKVENARLTALVSFYNSNEDLLLQLRVSDCPGLQSTSNVYNNSSPWYATFERISESYAKLGKEIAILIYEAEFKGKKNKIKN